VALLIQCERSEHEGGWIKTDLLQLNYYADLLLSGLANFSRESSRIFRPPQYVQYNLNLVSAEPAEPDHGDGRGSHLQGVPQHERPDVQVRQLQFSPLKHVVT
jgi:hypothetical protein